MGRTRSNIRQAVTRELGYPVIAATSSAGTATTLTDADELGRFPNDSLIGRWLYSAALTYPDRRITDSVQSTGVITVIPSDSGGVGAVAYEILPFAADAIHEAINDALMYLYDLGVLVRPFWMKGVTGSPIYNSDFSYWTSASVLHGWTAATATLARQQGATYKWVNEQSARLTTAAGQMTLDATWRRFLADFAPGTVTLRAWVRQSAASAARISIDDEGSATTNYSDVISVTNEWAMVSVEHTLDDSETDWTVRMRLATTDNVDFNDIWLEGSHTPTLHPLPMALAPSGPSEILVANVGTDTTNSRSLVIPDRARAIHGWTWQTFHDEAADVQMGMIVWKQPPTPGLRMWMKCEGPLSLPASDSAVVEIDQIEELLVAKMAALKLLENDIYTFSSDQAGRRAQRMGRLERDINVLIGGHGEESNYATFGPNW